MPAPKPLDPPVRLAGILSRVGPGIVIAGSIVGSGELVATTKVGAQAGFWLLWLVLVGCGIKVLTQVELGRDALARGRTTLDALDALPGPRARAGWAVWLWLAMTVLTVAQQGGIVGGVGQALAMTRPLTADGVEFNALQDRRIALQVDRALLAAGRVEPVLARRGALPPAELERALEREALAVDAELEGVGPPRDPVLWAGLLAALTALALAVGRYRLVQGVSTVLVGGFTAVTLLTLALLQARPEWAVQPRELAEGLSLRLPPRGDGPSSIPTALAAFGIIGVGAAELVMYPYWCQEKGYGRWTGTPDGSAGWVARARGWMRVMRWDAWLSMAVYTTATVAFYLLGAAVLGRAGLDPSGEHLVRTLAQMYEPVFGEWAPTLFLVGAFAVLYSTFFVGCAGIARIAADAAGVFGLASRDDATRRRWTRGLSVALPLLGFLLYACVRAPARMVIASGVAQALMLPVLGTTAIYHRTHGLPRALAPGRLWDVGLWLSCAGFYVAGGWILWSQLQELA